MKRAVILLGAVLLGFAWGAAAVKYRVFPHSLVAAAANHKDPLVEARRDYFETVQGPADLVFVGDSITQMIEWGEHFPGAVNRGISGDQTADVLSRIDSLKRLGAETYVIMLGVNDIGHGRSVAETAGNVQRIVNALPGRKIVLSVTPCNPAYGDCEPGRIDELNRRLSGIEGAAFVRSYLEPGDLADKVHPNASGMTKLVAAVESALHDQNPAIGE